MDQGKKDEAAKLAARAAQQGKNAGKNAMRAAGEATESVVNPITNAAEDAAETVIKDVTGTSQLTQGVVATVGAVCLSLFALSKFKSSRYPFSRGSGKS